MDVETRKVLESATDPQSEPELNPAGSFVLSCLLPGSVWKQQIVDVVRKQNHCADHLLAKATSNLRQNFLRG